MKLTKRVFMARVTLVLLLVLTAGTGHGQILRTSYFMEGTQYRMQLNPALAPERGFVNIPIVGNINAATRSDALTVDDVVDIFRNGGNDEYYTTEEFNAKLNERNQATANMSTDLIHAGWWHGKGFMSFNVSVRSDGYVSVPKELFSFMRDMKGLNSNDYSDYRRDLSDEELNVNVYTEIGAGYTRRLNDHVSIGGRVKCLLGQGNLNLRVDHAVAESHLTGVDPDINWSEAGILEVIKARGTGSIDITATLESSAEGLEYTTNERGYIERARFEAKNMGVAGIGVAADVGIACRVGDVVELSAALTDLGFINWNKDCTQIAHSNTSDLTFDSKSPGDISRFSGIMGQGEAINLHLLRLVPDEQSGASPRRTKLASTLAMGLNYYVMKDRFSLGVLYTDRFSHVVDGSELTFSANWHPRSLLDLSLSYSPILCGGSSIGFAVKAGPLFVGTDYMYMGSKTKCCNALVGLSIPLGHRQ